MTQVLCLAASVLPIVAGSATKSLMMLFGEQVRLPRR